MAENTQTGGTRGVKPRGRKRNLDLAVIMAAADREDDAGFCRLCGAQHQGIEPDARNYTCENCGKDQVFGAVELVLMLGF